MTVALDRTSALSGHGHISAWHGVDLTLGADFTALAPEWFALESQGTASIFQTHGFLDAWCRLAAAAAGETPLFVTGRCNGALQFILPLALTRRSGLTVMTWLAQSHANYGMGLLRPDAFAFFATHSADDLMKEIATYCGADVVHLDHQPVRWAGHANPFALGESARLTANDTYVVNLEEDFAAQHRELFSSRTMSTLKRKQRRLEEVGKVSFDPPAERAARQRMVAWFISEKHARLAEQGQDSVFDRPEIGGLYNHLLEMPDFDIDCLTVDESPVAVALTVHSGKIAYLLNTAYSGEEFARFSPGALLLHRHLANMQAKGARVFDFGPGALPYKLEWRPEVIPLVASSIAVSALGRPLQLLLSLGTATKCAVKRSDPLREAVFTMRRMAGTWRHKI
ncbi:MAG: GNAT family N-acetyltransferase [Pseudolabrys sp.]|nr:GNAT family N-acetyltransferase [Pseudolabrys sp.]